MGSQEMRPAINLPLLDLCRPSNTGNDGQVQVASGPHTLPLMKLIKSLSSNYMMLAVVLLARSKHQFGQDRATKRKGYHT